MTGKSGQAVLFDVDGTLVDSIYFHEVPWWQAFRQSGFTVPTDRIYRLIGMGGNQLICHFPGAEFSHDRVGPFKSSHDTIFSAYRPALVPFRASKYSLMRASPWSAHR